MKRHGRKKNYTDGGIMRLPCVRCGKKPSTHQWSACADGNLNRPLCIACDIKLNTLVLRWSKDPDAEAKIKAYKELWSAEVK